MKFDMSICIGGENNQNPLCCVVGSCSCFFMSGFD